MSTETNLSALHRALECFNDPARRASYLDLYDESVRLIGYAGVEPGLEGVRKFYENLWATFPDAVVQVEDAFGVDDKVVCRFTLTGTHRGDFLGVAATGKPISASGITILRFASGKCVERWSQADFLGVLNQISS